MKKLLTDFAKRVGSAALNEATKVATKAGTAALRSALEDVEQATAAGAEDADPIQALQRIDPHALGTKAIKEALTAGADGLLERVEAGAKAVEVGAGAAGKKAKQARERVAKREPPKKIKVSARVIDVEGKPVK